MMALLCAGLYAQDSSQTNTPDGKTEINSQPESEIQVKPGAQSKSTIRSKPVPPLKSVIQLKPVVSPKLGTQPKPGAPPRSGTTQRTWPTHPTDWLSVSQKRLDALRITAASNAGDGDVKKLLERAADLMEQAKASKDYQFQYGRRLLAAGAVMDATDRILMAMKIDRAPEESDIRRAGFVLQECYFRVRQADYFAGISGDKKSSQYVSLATRLYQQGRSAYDAKEYSRARLLGDASTSVVFALECMAQASTPDPHIYR